MRTLIFAVVLAAVSGCGGEDDGVGEESNGRVPADYLPTDVDVSGLTKAQQICVLDVAVTNARVAECDHLGPADSTRWVRVGGTAFWRDYCTLRVVTMDAYTPPAEDSHIPRCLNYRAAAPCEALAIPAAQIDPTNVYADCEIVVGTW
jgi:hypothetical protein